MGITHVLRGDDHLANTPKHVALFRALGAPVPRFAHLGMILGTDRRSSRSATARPPSRSGGTQGILPEALVNFLALLGWSPGEDREILTRRGDGAGVLAGPSGLFSLGLRPGEASLDERAVHGADARRGAPRAFSAPCRLRDLPERERALNAIELHRTRARTTIEMGRALSTYAKDPEEYDPRGLKKQSGPRRPVRSRLSSRRSRRSRTGPSDQSRGGVARNGRGSRHLCGKAHPSGSPGSHGHDRGRSPLRRPRASGEGDVLGGG